MPLCCVEKNIKYISLFTNSLILTRGVMAYERQKDQVSK